jgi:hypothetical protein
MDRFASQSAQLLAERFLFAQKSSQSPPRGSVSQNRTNEPVGEGLHTAAALIRPTLTAFCSAAWSRSVWSA